MERFWFWLAGFAVPMVLVVGFLIVKRVVEDHKEQTERKMRDIAIEEEDIENFNRDMAVVRKALDDLRPKGRWNIVEFDEVSRRITIECSECGMVEELTVMAYGFGHNFCHICGADMRGGGEDG